MAYLDRGPICHMTWQIIKLNKYTKKLEIIQRHVAIIYGLATSLVITTDHPLWFGSFHKNYLQLFYKLRFLRKALRLESPKKKLKKKQKQEKTTTNNEEGFPPYPPSRFSSLQPVPHRSQHLHRENGR